MKAMLFICSIWLLGTIGYGLVYVSGYYRNNGTYVESHYRTNPDGIKWNNWSYDE